MIFLSILDWHLHSITGSGSGKKILKCLNYIHLILILMRMVWRQELQILVGSHIIFCYRKFTLGRSEKTISVLFSFVLPVSYTHLRAHETRHDLVCRLLLEK